MKIELRFFASLRERAGRQDGAFEAPDGVTVAEIWDAACPGVPLPDNTLAAINMEYVGMDSPVSDGDEVAFFPPVTGGGARS